MTKSTRYNSIRRQSSVIKKAFQLKTFFSVGGFSSTLYTNAGKVDGTVKSRGLSTGIITPSSSLKKEEALKYNVLIIFKLRKKHKKWYSSLVATASF
jgi:hypothetical protein